MESEGLNHYIKLWVKADKVPMKIMLNRSTITKYSRVLSFIISIMKIIHSTYVILMKINQKNDTSAIFTVKRVHELSNAHFWKKKK